MLRSLKLTMVPASEHSRASSVINLDDSDEEEKDEGLTEEQKLGELRCRHSSRYSPPDSEESHKVGVVHLRLLRRPLRREGQGEWEDSNLPHLPLQPLQVCEAALSGHQRLKLVEWTYSPCKRLYWEEGRTSCQSIREDGR